MAVVSSSTFALHSVRQLDCQGSGLKITAGARFIVVVACKSFKIEAIHGYVYRHKNTS
jgi:hypothetical protein